MRTAALTIARVLGAFGAFRAIGVVGALGVFGAIGLFGALGVLSGCDRPPAATLPGSLPKPWALRIVSASPAVTEICCALGVRDQLVGRTSYCAYPPGVEEIPSIGALIDVSTERLLDLRPDLIILSGHSRAQRDRFEPLGIRIESIPDTTLDDIFMGIRRVGELIGRAPAAEALCLDMERRLRETDAQFAATAPQRVLLLIDTLADPPQPPVVAGPGSFYDDLLRRAGHENVSAEAHKPFGQLSLEAILAADPDVIVELDPDGASRPNGRADALAAWSKLGSLEAVQSGRVVVLSGDKYYVPGPRVTEIYADLCAGIAAVSDPPAADAEPPAPADQGAPESAAGPADPESAGRADGEPAGRADGEPAEPTP